MAGTVIVYTETQAKDLRCYDPTLTVIAAPNALYSAAEMGARQSNRSDLNVLYVGRLVAEKKPAVLLEAFLKCLPQLPPTSQLQFVGWGPAIEQLRQRASESPYGDRIKFLGYVSERRSLEELYAHALVSVSPGYVGLSITQSFSFGVPMVISRDEPHSPEIEAAIPGVNCAFFSTDDADDLARTILRFYENQTEWLSRRNSIARKCSGSYSTEIMAERLLEFLRK